MWGHMEFRKARFVDLYPAKILESPCGQIPEHDVVVGYRRSACEVVERFKKRVVLLHPSGPARIVRLRENAPCVIHVAIFRKNARNPFCAQYSKADAMSPFTDAAQKFRRDLAFLAAGA